MENKSPEIEILRLRPEQDGDIPIPRYMSAHAAGMDICAAVAEPVTIEPGRIVLISTGLAVAVPPGFEAQIRPRSGLAVRHGIGLINAPGTIDADYRGEVKIAVINLGSAPYTISRGDRIAQMVIQRIFTARLVQVDRLDDTERSGGGFGSTGVG